MAGNSLRLGICFAVCLGFVAPTSATVTILANDNDFQSTPTLITFDDISFCSGSGCITTFATDRYQPQGAHIVDGLASTCDGAGCPLNGTSAPAAYSATAGGPDSGCGFPTCSVPPHSGLVAIADSDRDIPAGCIVIRFVTPGTSTPTSALEAGIWVHGGKEQDCVQFFDANDNLLATLSAPADFWTFAGVRATQGVRSIRFLGSNIGLPQGGGYLVDDLKFGGSPMMENQPPVITQGTSTNLSARCNSNCPNAANNVSLSATDPDGSAASLMWSIQTQPTRGTVSPQSGSGASFTPCYDPNNMQTMADSFVVKVTDGSGATDTITVNVTIQNDAPIITQGSSLPLNVLRNSQCGCPLCPDTGNSLMLSATDTETTGPGLNWSITSLPNTGSVCFQGGQTGGSITLRYSPFAAQSSADFFTVRVSDDCGANASIMINVTVSSACSIGQKGDMNVDGIVDGNDMQIFVDTLLDPSTKSAVQKCRADVGSIGNQCVPDDLVNVSDVPGFSLLLLQGTCP